MIDVDEDTREVLDRYGFDAERFERLRGRVADGSLSAASNVVRGRVEPPAPEDIVPLPGREDDADARAAGLEAIRAGEVAIVVLNGGMATRFGGVVKGTVAVLDGRSFLELKLAAAAEVAARLGTVIPAAVMTSFATDAAHTRIRGGAPPARAARTSRSPSRSGSSPTARSSAAPTAGPRSTAPATETSSRRFATRGRSSACGRTVPAT